MSHKELQQKHIKDTFRAVQETANRFKSEKDKIESEWNKYFQEVVKHSDNFELIKTPRTQAYEVKPYVLDADGTYSYSSERVLLGTVDVNYNEFEIIYTGKLPEGENNRSIRVFIEEHTTTPRGSWRSTSHGYKLKVRLGYDDSKTYYKTGRPVVKMVEDYVKSKWDAHNAKIKARDLKTKAFGLAFSKYRNSIVDFGGNRINNLVTNYNQIVVKNNNGSVVVLNYRDVNGEVEFTVAQVSYGSLSADSVIEALGSVK